jgi:hypothetical protein
MKNSLSESIPPFPGTIFLTILLIIIYIAGMVLFPYDSPDFALFSTYDALSIIR